MGLSALVAYKMRAGLTILGVVMGIMTVTGMSAIVAGLNESMATQIEGFGTAVIFVRPFGPGENLSDEERRRRKGLSETEVEALVERCQTCAAIAPLELPAVQNIKYGREKVQNAQLIGTTPAYETVHDVCVERGRFLSPSDVNRGVQVAVIGTEIAETLFPYVDPVDKEITLDGIRFRVIGVMERKGKFLNFNRDNLILVPLGSMVRAIPASTSCSPTSRPPSPAQMERATDEIREILRRQRKLKFAQKDTFMMFTQDTLTNLYNQLTGGIYLVMIAISSIGLVVGGVGRHEHHAGVGHGADARDRRAQGAGRAQARHPLAVPHRGHDPHRRGRSARHRDRGRRGLAGERVLAVPGRAPAHLGRRSRSSRRVVRA